MHLTHMAWPYLSRIGTGTRASSAATVQQYCVSTCLYWTRCGLQVCGTFRSAAEGQKLAPIDDQLQIILSELVDTCSAEVGVY